LILAQKSLCNGVFAPTASTKFLSNILDADYLPTLGYYFPDAKPIHAEKSNVLF
jgi:hypothetical protein